MVELKAKLGHVTISCATRGALVSVDGRRVGVTPLPAPIWLVPGAHQVGLGRYDLTPSIQRVDVVPGKEMTVTFQLRVAENTPPATAAAPEAKATPPAIPPPAAPPPASPSPSVPVLLTVDDSANRKTTPPPGEDASWPALARNWRFWTAVGGGVVVTAIIFAIANSGGDGGSPSTTLGSQHAFQ
jgi:hypothetical protein